MPGGWRTRRDFPPIPNAPATPAMRGTTSRKRMTWPSRASRTPVRTAWNPPSTKCPSAPTTITRSRSSTPTAPKSPSSTTALLSPAGTRERTSSAGSTSGTILPRRSTTIPAKPRPRSSVPTASSWVVPGRVWHLRTKRCIPLRTSTRTPVSTAPSPGFTAPTGTSSAPIPNGWWARTATTSASRSLSWSSFRMWMSR